MILDDWRSVAAGLPVNPFYERIAGLLPPDAHVLDAGAGLGQGASFLRSLGHDVTALEPDPAMAKVLRDQGFRVIEAGFDAAPPEGFDAVLCVFSLFFEHEERFPAAWERLIQAVGQNGLWGGQLLGERDEWVETQPVIGLPRPVIEQMLSDFEVVDWEEVKRPGCTAWGVEKRWHIHHIIARRRPVQKPDTLRI